MVETKSVRIENWGSHFLQKLQVFFSKTDYCDLTLQFEGNVQLKVHRLVMNACTEYFTYLEQTCPSMEENTIMMPPDLQADVIVPIVNFMYTGMLEYNPVFFERLYKATQVMKISVLTQMMEAQLHKPVSMKKAAKINPFGTASTSNKQSLPGVLPGRKLPVWKRNQHKANTTASHPVTHPVSITFNSESKWSDNLPASDPLAILENTAKPTRFEWPDEELPTQPHHMSSISLIDSSFYDFSYNSKPLLTKEEEQKASTSLGVKKAKEEYVSVEEGKIKSSSGSLLFMEDGQVAEDSNKRKGEGLQKGSPKRAKVVANNTETTTLTLKNNAGNDLDHAKIVSEILKKYPQLAKKNKNIRLKIMSKSPVKEEEAPERIRSYAGKSPTKSKNAVPPPAKSNIEIRAEQAIARARASKSNNLNEDGPWTCLKCDADKDPPEFVLYYLYRKHMTDAHGETFDPELCKYCGKRCLNTLLMMYHMFTKHGLKPPPHYSFPKCDKCPYIAYSDAKMFRHLSTHKQHEVRCSACRLTFKNQASMTYHVQSTGHFGKYRQQCSDCQYCLKKLTNPVNLFSHLKSQHFTEAKDDGVVGLDETMDVEAPEILSDPEVMGVVANSAEEVEEERDVDSPTHKDKVKIISNVKVGGKQEDVNSAEEGMESANGGLATSLGLVDIVVLDENQQPYIIQQQQNECGDTEYILPALQNSDGTFNAQVITTQNSTVIPQGVLQTAAGTDITSTDELVMVLTDHDYPDEQHQVEQGDNSNIVVLYSHPVDGQQGQFITSQGNIMVNSQTGMLEIRNGDTAIATTTASHVFVNETTDSPGESIEMIQREIDGHVTTEQKEEVIYEEDVKPNISAIEETHEEHVNSEPVEENRETVEEKECQQNENEETQVEDNVADTSQEVDEHLEDTEQQLDKINQHLEKIQEDIVEKTAEINEIIEKQAQDAVDNPGDCIEEEPMEVEDIAGPSGEIKENEQQNTVENNEEQMEEQDTSQDNVTEEETHTEPSQNEETEDSSKDVPPEATNTEATEENITEISEEKEDTQETITEETQPMEIEENINEHLNDSAETEEQLHLNTIEEHESETNIVNEEQHAVTEEMGEADKSIEELDESIQESVDETDNNTSGTTAEEVEDHHEDCPVAKQQDEETKEVVTKQSVAKKPKINKAILQDWGEDTDSQHSDKDKEETEERVSKLVDDWEEEEEEDRIRDE